jgi:hypothetical protein
MAAPLSLCLIPQTQSVERMEYLQGQSLCEKGRFAGLREPWTATSSFGKLDSGKNLRTCMKTTRSEKSSSQLINMFGTFI